MDTNTKGCLIFFIVIILVAIGIFIGFVYSFSSNQKDFAGDNIKYSKICDTIQEIKDNPKFTLSEFKKSELSKIFCYLIRQNKVIKDTILFFDTLYLSTLYFPLTIPFNQLRKTDTVIVETRSNKYFSITNFHYYAYLHFGNLGYLGSYDCRCAENNYIVNGIKIYNNCLQKSNSKDKLLINYKR